MVCTANDLLGWKDFPKGLRILLLDDDLTFATEIKSKLEEMDYVVSTFYRTNEALSAISDNSKGFHVAIVEVRAANSDERFKFLENAKELPTIMTSDVNCLSTMMKCIALGAVEFLKKPLSDDKLRNIWQHVAHKAFNGGSKEQSDPLNSEKFSVASVPHLQSETKVKPFETQNQEHNEVVCDKFPAPSTPRIKQGLRLVDNGDCQHQDQDQDQGQGQGQTKLSMEKDYTNHDGESKFVETTCDDISKTENDKSKSNECHDKKLNEAFERRVTESHRKKVKVDWTPKLHKKFVHAVEQLGVDQAIPSRILELMNVDGLTRHNIASHLQKYRLQRRHILPKGSERRLPQPTLRNYYAQKPIVAYPPYHSNHTHHAWVLPHGYPPRIWAPPYYPAWQSSESWQWNPYQGVHAEAWGCPMPPRPSFPQNASPFQGRDSVQSGQTMLKNSVDHYPGEELLDKVVEEAINKPWLPLPLGLKPPSTESVITELSKQGISTVPPRINGTRPC